MWVLCISPESNEMLQLLQAHDRRTSEFGGWRTSLSVVVVVVVVAVRAVAVTVMRMSGRIRGVLSGFGNLVVSRVLQKMPEFSLLIPGSEHVETAVLTALVLALNDSFSFTMKRIAARIDDPKRIWKSATIALTSVGSVLSFRRTKDIGVEEWAMRVSKGRFSRLCGRRITSPPPASLRCTSHQYATTHIDHA